MIEDEEIIVKRGGILVSILIVDSILVKNMEPDLYVFDLAYSENPTVGSIHLQDS